MLPHPQRTMPTFRSELGTEEGEHGGCMEGPLGMMKQTSHVVKGRARLLSVNQAVKTFLLFFGLQTGDNRSDTA